MLAHNRRRFESGTESSAGVAGLGATAERGDGLRFARQYVTSDSDLDLTAESLDLGA